MVYSLYSIYDKVAGVFSEPFLGVNDNTAKRRFIYQMQNSAMVAGDCALYKVGEFSTDDGKIVQITVEFLCNFEKEFE